MKIPDGYITIPRGGAPAKLDRDIGVFLMRHLLKDIRGGKAIAVDPEVVEHFSLTDESAMRKCICKVEKKFGFVRKAKKRSDFEWQALQVFDDAVMLARVVPVPSRMVDVAARQALHKVWLWAEGWPAAMPLSSELGAGMQPTGLSKWLSYGKKP